MRARFAILAAASAALIVGAPSTARASHHLWRFSQMFSNASGTVQFIQLEVNEDGENLVDNFTVTSDTHTFTFPVNAFSNTQTSVHKWILLGTANLATLPGGVAPDFTIPANFFPTGTGTLHYAGATDTWTYTGLPADGHTAIFKASGTTTTGTGVNAPTNFNLQTGSLALAASVPAASARWIAVLVGGLLLAASGLLRARKSPRRFS